jgi:hypothetical protein
MLNSFVLLNTRMRLVQFQRLRLHPLNSCLPSGANVGEFLQAVHERDELNKVHHLTYIDYVDSQCIQLSTSTVETETFSLLPCKDFTFAEAYMLVPNLDKMIKGTMTTEDSEVTIQKLSNANGTCDTSATVLKTPAGNFPIAKKILLKNLFSIL